MKIFDGGNIKQPDYKDRVKQGHLVDARSNKTDVHFDYDNNITNSVFWGLNFKDGGASFSVIKIDQADAFTLHVDKVAIIPRDLFSALQSFIDDELPLSELHATYSKYKNKGE